VRSEEQHSRHVDPLISTPQPQGRGFRGDTATSLVAAKGGRGGWETPLGYFTVKGIVL